VKRNKQRKLNAKLELRREKLPSKLPKRKSESRRSVIKRQRRTKLVCRHANGLEMKIILTMIRTQVAVLKKMQAAAAEAHHPHLRAAHNLVKLLNNQSLLPKHNNPPNSRARAPTITKRIWIAIVIAPATVHRARKKKRKKMPDHRLRPSLNVLLRSLKIRKIKMRKRRGQAAAQARHLIKMLNQRRRLLSSASQLNLARRK
jgi:hypothetical protein